MAWYMGLELFGMRVHDVIRCVDYAVSRPDIKEIRLIGQGAGALWAMHAAALDARVNSVVAERGLLSYRSLAQVDRYTHNAGIFIRDVLKHYDLPQVAAAIAPRPLTLLSPNDPMKRHVNSEATVAEAYRFTREAYREAGAADAFRVVIRGSAEETYKRLERCVSFFSPMPAARPILATPLPVPTATCSPPLPTPLPNDDAALMGCPVARFPTAPAVPFPTSQAPLAAPLPMEAAPEPTSPAAAARLAPARRRQQHHKGEKCIPHRSVRCMVLQQGYGRKVTAA